MHITLISHTVHLHLAQCSAAIYTLHSVHRLRPPLHSCAGAAGDKYGAEIVFHWMRRVAREPPMPMLAEAEGAEVPRTFYSTRTCYDRRERQYKPCLYDALNPVGSPSADTAGSTRGAKGGASLGASTSPSTSHPQGTMGGRTEGIPIGTPPGGRTWETRWGRPPMSCFSFDEMFGGILAAPRVLAADGWSYTEHEVRAAHPGVAPLE